MTFSSVIHGATIAVVLTAAASHAQAAYSSLIVFGDSLSDTGNVQARLAPLGIDLPAIPYAQDRFSNGPVAVEVMAQALNLPLVSHAYGGALTGMDNRIPAGGLLAGTGMQSQVNAFTAGLGSAPADASALYVLWGGGNDMFSLLDSPTPDPAAVIGQAVGNLSAQVGQLHASGARDFFIPLLPDLADTYGAIQAGPATRAQLSALTRAFNTALSTAMGQLQLGLTDADIHVFNTQAVLDGVRAQLVAGSGTVDAPCWTGDYTGAGGTLCANPDQYFLFDHVHPTAVVHRATGLAMAAAVPEPQAWALLLAGVATMGLVGARRRACA